MDHNLALASILFLSSPLHSNVERVRRRFMSCFFSNDIFNTFFICRKFNSLYYECCKTRRAKRNTEFDGLQDKANRKMVCVRTEPCVDINKWIINTRLSVMCRFERTQFRNEVYKYSGYVFFALSRFCFVFFSRIFRTLYASFFGLSGFLLIFRRVTLSRSVSFIQPDQFVYIVLRIIDSSGNDTMNAVMGSWAQSQHRTK